VGEFKLTRAQQSHHELQSLESVLEWCGTALARLGNSLWNTGQHSTRVLEYTSVRKDLAEREGCLYSSTVVMSLRQWR